MDITMPSLNGLEATERIVKAFPKVRVIILSRHENEEYYWRALRMGASGYLLKNAIIAELKTALRRVAAGEVYLSREISNRLRRYPLHEIARAPSPVGQLSERQREILQLIAEGANHQGHRAHSQAKPQDRGIPPDAVDASASTSSTSRAWSASRCERVWCRRNPDQPLPALGSGSSRSRTRSEPPASHTSVVFA